MGNNPSYFKDCKDCPVEQVSWDEVVGFIQKVNVRFGKKFDSRVLRGGTWANDSSSVRVRDRNGRGPYLRLHTLGFRLAK